MPARVLQRQHQWHNPLLFVVVVLTACVAACDEKHGRAKHPAPHWQKHDQPAHKKPHHPHEADKHAPHDHDTGNKQPAPPQDATTTMKKPDAGSGSQEHVETERTDGGAPPAEVFTP